MLALAPGHVRVAAPIWNSSLCHVTFMSIIFSLLRVSNDERLRFVTCSIQHLIDFARQYKCELSIVKASKVDEFYLKAEYQLLLKRLPVSHVIVMSLPPLVGITCTLTLHQITLHYIIVHFIRHVIHLKWHVNKVMYDSWHQEEHPATN